MIRNTVLLTVILCALVSATSAQNYHPADIGNTWVLESTDAAERITYTLETSEEELRGEQFRTLKIITEVLGTSSVNTNTFLIEVNAEGMKLHKVVAELGDVFGISRVEFSPPAVFFPPTLQVGEIWETIGETEVDLVGNVTVSSTNEVVAIEDVVTPAGTFQDCLKIRILTKTTAVGGSSRSTSYQWLAPDLGPVKFETGQDIVFELVSFDLVTPTDPYDVNGDGVVNILDLTFVASRLGQNDPKADVNGDAAVNILDLVLVAQNFGN
ncbi:MAG: dockerin type I domain-containing protein [Candidatus Poribacteria bacterium]|nr:dockerin type I domain-containing protein [Candidatus Poribacteria bacterium]